MRRPDERWGRCFAQPGSRPRPTLRPKRLAEPPARRPVCLVLDVELGGMSGLDLQQRLRRYGSTLPVIVMTGLDDARVRELAEDRGCAAVVSKESDSGHLLRLIERLWAGG
jgi:FixJ family two-component response regulator